MAYCTRCGNQVADDASFCSSCGAAVIAPSSPDPQSSPPTNVQPPQVAPPPPPPQPTPLPPQPAGTGFDIATDWGIFLLAGGLLAGLIALFIGWTDAGESFNGIDWITEDEGAPWWLGLSAILAFIGVGLLVLTFLGRVVPGSPLPDVPGIGALGALLLALCPLITHVGFWLWVGFEFDADPGEVWEGLWETDGAGIWLALAAGIAALIGTSAIAKPAGRSP